MLLPVMMYASSFLCHDENVVKPPENGVQTGACLNYQSNRDDVSGLSGLGRANFANNASKNNKSPNSAEAIVMPPTEARRRLTRPE